LAAPLGLAKASFRKPTINFLSTWLGQLLTVLAQSCAGQTLGNRPLDGLEGNVMTIVTRRELLAVTTAAAFALATPAHADAPAPFSANEIVDNGQRFFGNVSHGLADVVQEAVSPWGLPNAYILGQEASGAFVGGLRYGEGKMYTRNAGNEPVFWQGHSALMPALTAIEQ
jgi:hypothetical protein